MNKTIHKAIESNGVANYKIIVQGVIGEKILASYNGMKIITEKGEDENYLGTLFICIMNQVELTGDVLAGNTTLLMKKELYALPMTLGVAGYMVFIHWFPEQGLFIGTTCALVAFFIRANWK